MMHHHNHHHHHLLLLLLLFIISLCIHEAHIGPSKAIIEAYRADLVQVGIAE